MATQRFEYFNRAAIWQHHQLRSFLSKQGSLLALRDFFSIDLFSSRAYELILRLSYPTDGSSDPQTKEEFLLNHWSVLAIFIKY